jgi:O-methyltransferase
MKLSAKIVHTVRTLGPRRLARYAAARLRGPNPIRPWQSDPDFLRRVSEIESHTLVDRRRLYMLAQLARQAAPVPGHVAEVGVYRGGSAKLLAGLAAEARKQVLLFDTFSGMPDADSASDLHRRGDFADTSLESVRAFLSDNPNVAFHPGLFPDSAAPLARETFSLVHVDVDIYPSVKACCEFFYPRLARGGVLVFDDYGFLPCPGAKRAVDEFFASTADRPVYLPSGQCAVWRIAEPVSFMSSHMTSHGQERDRLP